MQRERKLQAIRQTLGHEEITKGDEVVFFCPKCQHRKPKLSVNLARDFFNCWTCSFRGKTLIPLFPRTARERDEYIEEVKEREFSREEKVEKRYDQPHLPPHFKSLSKPGEGLYYRAAMAYLAERGIDRGDILRWKLGYCEDGEYRNRIIIPSFDEFGCLNFVVGRGIYENQLKYKHGNFNKDIVWNDYLVDWDRPIVITEGPFDAFKAHDNVVALQGSILNTGSKLFAKVVLSNTEVFFAMDEDAFRKQLEIIQNLIAYGVQCRYVGLGGKKDVGEMSKEEFAAAKERSITVSSDLDLLKLRILA